MELDSQKPDPKQLGTCYLDFTELQKYRAGKDI